MGKSKNFDVMSFLQSYSQSLSRKIIVNFEFYDVLTLTSVTRICAPHQPHCRVPLTASAATNDCPTDQADQHTPLHSLNDAISQCYDINQADIYIYIDFLLLWEGSVCCIYIYIQLLKTSR